MISQASYHDKFVQLIKSKAITLCILYFSMILICMLECPDFFPFHSFMHFFLSSQLNLLLALRDHGAIIRSGLVESSMAEGQCFLPTVWPKENERRKIEHPGGKNPWKSPSHLVRMKNFYSWLLPPSLGLCWKTTRNLEYLLKISVNIYPHMLKYSCDI